MPKYSKRNKSTKHIRPHKRLSLKEMENTTHKRKLTKKSNRKYQNNTNIGPIEADKKRQENERIINLVDKMLTKFMKFQQLVKYEDDVDEIKDMFQSEMCKDNLFSVQKTICGVGSYKVVLLCKENIADCKYVYAFDFKHHPDEEGDEKFMQGGQYEDLYQLNKILSIAPIFHKKLYCGYSNMQRVN